MDPSDLTDPTSARMSRLSEVFGLLADPTRIAILEELAGSPGPATFSDLRQGLGNPNSGHFNYHLNKLTGHFLRKTDEGYVLRLAGEQVVRAMHAGIVPDDVTVDPVEIDEWCPYCGSQVELRYGEERMTARCTSCEGVVAHDLRGTYLSYRFPAAGLVDRTPAEALQAAHTLYDAKVAPMMDGVCPECAGRTTVALDYCDDHDAGPETLCTTCRTKFRTWAEYACDRCGYARRCAAWFEALNHPAVVAFLHEKGGLDATIPFRKLTWENGPFVRDIVEEVVTQSPLRLRFTFPVDQASLSVTVDDDLSVVDVEERLCGEPA